MATSQLTERQQQIKELKDKGRSTKQIAKALKITENGVYQHMRRIRAIEGNGTKPAAKSATKAARRTASKSAARAKSLKSGGSTAKTTSKPAAKRTTPVAPKPARPLATNLSPLEAIELRKAEITDGLRETQATLDETRTAFESAVAAHDAAAQAHAEELRNLDLAERAIKGEIKRPAPNKQRKAPAPTNGASEATVPPAAAPEPPAPAPAPAEPVAAEPEPVAVAAEPAAMERPGVPSDPDFEQGGDPFGADAE